MRQPVRRGVAPLNTNPKWPEGYVASLREAGAQEKTIPFFLTWVRRFFARFPNRSRRDLGRTEIEMFLREMARHAGVSNWQIAQARDALKIYYEQFRGIALAARPDGVVPGPAPQHSSAGSANTDGKTQHPKSLAAGYAISPAADKPKDGATRGTAGINVVRPEWPYLALFDLRTNGSAGASPSHNVAAAALAFQGEGEPPGEPRIEGRA